MTVKRSIQGFSLMEMAVAVVILGILATMAVPNMTRVIEIFRSHEGIRVLEVVLQGQIAADADVAEGRIASYTLADLDVTFAAPDNFNAPVLNWNGAAMTVATVTINAVAYPYHASIQRSTAAYTFYIQGNDALNSKIGRILCAPQSECAVMQYCPWRTSGC